MLVRSLTLMTLLILVSLQASAYIPTSKFILIRLAKNNGKGIYQVDQDVQFRTEVEPLVLREHWIVENGDTLRLTVTGKSTTENYHYEALYRDGRRYTIDATGNVKTSAIPTEFFEPYLYYRTSKSIMDLLIHQKVLPANFSAYKKQVKSFNNVVYPYESFVHLARVAGVITYALGQPTPARASKPNAGVWIDQDAFVLRRLRYPTKTEIEADNHLFAAGGFRIPRDRTITWENSSATIKVASVKPAAASAIGKVLSSSSLQGKARLPDNPQVQDFYSRFR